MISIAPATIEVADLTSNVAITETAWTAGTYTKGTERYVGIDLYEVVADPSTDDEPTVGAAKDTPTWIKIGQINRWRMFNGALYQPTVQTGGPIEVEIEADGIINAVALLKCDAAEVMVTITDPSEGEVYSKTVQLVDNSGITNWYDWFFAPIKRKTEAVLLDLPAYAGVTVGVTISSGATGDVSCGGLVIGRQTTIGETYLNYTIRNRYFSRRERSVFGDFIDILSRPMAREATFDVFLSTPLIAGAMKSIDDRRDLPTVYVGGEAYDQTIVFGFPDEPEVEQLSAEAAKLKLTILGLT